MNSLKLSHGWPVSYDCKILKDSISPDGVRLTTFELTFPRFILAEFNTHRILSKNSASSRAIPTEKIIDRVCREPFIPEFNQRVTGMGVGDPLTEEEQAEARSLWLTARDESVVIAEKLLHVDKSRVNRLLEPFMWHTVICTGTEWDNFFALRAHKDAQPEFRIVAEMMKAFHDTGEPVERWKGEWHLPLVEDDEIDHDNLGFWLGVSAGRCARVSYDRHNDSEDPQKSWDRADGLLGAGHMSPFEHQGTPMVGAEGYKLFRQDRYAWSGNFFGWSQYRKFIVNEDNYAAKMEAA
jgi:hypothetical protein